MERRTVIADAAISLIADAGLRALTHRGLDTALDLPAGSTSYYFRTKEKLLGAVIERITESSREAFELSGISNDPVDVTVGYLEHLLDARFDQLRARHALLIDPSVAENNRTALAACLFSVERAEALFDDRATAEGFVALCEGLVIAALMQAGSVQWGSAASGPARGRIELRIPVVTYLQGAGKA